MDGAGGAHLSSPADRHVERLEVNPSPVFSYYELKQANRLPTPSPPISPRADAMRNEVRRGKGVIRRRGIAWPRSVAL
jgi:hypothetical protein